MRSDDKTCARRSATGLSAPISADAPIYAAIPRASARSALCALRLPPPARFASPPTPPPSVVPQRHAFAAHHWRPLSRRRGSPSRTRPPSMPPSLIPLDRPFPTARGGLGSHTRRTKGAPPSPLRSRAMGRSSGVRNHSRAIPWRAGKSATKLVVASVETIPFPIQRLARPAGARATSLVGRSPAERPVWSRAHLRSTMRATNLVARRDFALGRRSGKTASRSVRNPSNDDAPACAECVPRRPKFRHNRNMSKTLQKNIRVTPEQWARIEDAAQSTHSTANQLVIELAIEALDRRAWPRTAHEIRLLRSSMFAAQAIARTMIADGRGDEVEQIRRSISEWVPELQEGSELRGTRDRVDEQGRRSHRHRGAGEHESQRAANAGRPQPGRR